MTASAAPSSSRRGLYVLKLVCTDHACCSHSVSANNPCLLATRMLACAHPTPALRDTRSRTHTRAPVRTRARERARTHLHACMHGSTHACTTRPPASPTHLHTRACPLPTQSRRRHGHRLLPRHRRRHLRRCYRRCCHRRLRLRRRRLRCFHRPRCRLRHHHQYHHRCPRQTPPAPHRPDNFWEFCDFFVSRYAAAVLTARSSVLE